MNPWVYIIVGLFALLGVWTFVRGVAAGWNRIIGTVNDLASTLKEATEIARAYREDLAILRQIAQSGSPTPNFGEEPESIVPKPPPSTMPPPLWSRFPTKPEEPDAPAESIRDVDVTATDEEVLEQEGNEAILNFEANERQKAATREADHVRIKEILEASGKPEGQ
jgi:hypothetical protein